ncbi:GFA family protein [Arenibacterium sp. CAU 1754]
MHKGSCNCGGVAFELAGDLAPPSVCHCTQCRKQSGHVWASTHVPQSALTLTAEDSLRWYRSSDTAQRGFCGTCGAFLFWKHNDEDNISVSMGAFDTPTGVTLARHIFVADKGEYYDLNDGLPQKAQ